MIELSTIVECFNARLKYYLNQYNQIIAQNKSRNGAEPSTSTTAKSFFAKVKKCTAALNRLETEDLKILTIGETKILIEELIIRSRDRHRTDRNELNEYLKFLND